MNNSTIGITVQRHRDAQGNLLNPAKYCVGDIHRGDWIEFKMVTPDSGWYAFNFYTARKDWPKDPDGVIEIWVNGQYKASSEKIKPTGGWWNFDIRDASTYTDSTVYMTKNTNIIRFVSGSDWPFNLDRFMVCLSDPKK